MAFDDEVPPGEQHCLIHLQDSGAEPGPDPIAQPGFELRTKARVSNALDPEDNLRHRYPAQVIGDGRRAAGPGRHRCVAPSAVPR